MYILTKFAGIYITVYVFVIMISSYYNHVACNSNNTILTKNTQNLRQRRVTLETRDDHGFFIPYDNLEIRHDKNARAIMFKIKELYDIGEQNPGELINILSNSDPFGVSRLTNPHEFVCNKSEMFPYHVDHDKLGRFKNNEAGYYIFFQHIRKAGGTTMCAIAQENLLPNQTSPNYCFLDRWTGSLGSYPYNDIDFFQKEVQARGLRYVPNEASPFDDDFFNYHGAIFATMFREPMDRWYSQYRFDYLEGRYMTAAEQKLFDLGHRLTFVEWYRTHNSWFTSPNVYTNAFIGQTLSDSKLVQVIMDRTHGPRNPYYFYWGYHERAKIPINHRNFLHTLDNLSKFSMIFILEWLNDEASSQLMLKGLLGWTKTVEHVLPQQDVVKREDSHSHHNMTFDVSYGDYMDIARDNVYDLLLYQVAKRIFVERLKCHDA